jgi:hypothetical protein
MPPSRQFCQGDSFDRTFSAHHLPICATPPFRDELQAILVCGVIRERLPLADACMVDDMVDRTELGPSGLRHLLRRRCLTISRSIRRRSVTVRSRPSKRRAKLQRRNNRTPGMPGQRLLRCLPRRPWRRTVRSFTFAKSGFDKCWDPDDPQEVSFEGINDKNPLSR